MSLDYTRDSLWSGLTDGQYERLCECRSLRRDLVPIAVCFAKAYPSESSEDALVRALEHLDMNGQFIDLTDEEYEQAVEDIERRRNMKRQIKASEEDYEDEEYDDEYDDEDDEDLGVKLNENGWPVPDFWEGIEDWEYFEDAWDTYLCGPEQQVNEELKIYPEPSTQAGIGSVYIFDESGEDRWGGDDDDDDEYDQRVVDFDDWCATECQLAIKAKSAEEYKELYRNWMKEVCGI